MQLHVNENKNWYVLITRPRAEKKVSTCLNSVYIENYLPVRRELRKWHDRKKWIESPLFASYIFVKTYETARSKVFEVDGLVKYVGTHGKAAIITEEEILRIEKICSYAGEISIERDCLSKGDEVEIVGGHFKGIHGHILQVGKNNKLQLSIPTLGFSALVEIDKEFALKVV